MKLDTSTELVATPVVGLIDEPLQIALRGSRPNAEVTISAVHVDARGAAWKAQANFVADGAGRVDLAQSAPVSGAYSGVDREGLVRSLRLDRGADQRPFNGSTLEPVRIDFSATIVGQRVASTSVERLYIATGVKQLAVHEDGINGLLFTPAGPARHPGVIVFGGSGGGLGFSAQTAALLAGHGYASLALAYFGLPSLPNHLVGIPLEYFARACAWLTRQDCIQADGIGVMGISRGAELALLLGSRLPLVRAVVAYSPSHAVWNGLQQDRIVETSAWSELGRELPFVPLDSVHLSSLLQRVFSETPISLAPLFHAALDSPTSPDAVIPAERTNGPILLVSGEDDQMWPATRMAELVMKRLAEHGHPFVSRHCHYPGAGHIMRPPGASTAILAGKFAFGGECATQAAANRAAWDETLDFLESNLVTRPKVHSDPFLIGG